MVAAVQQQVAGDATQVWGVIDTSAIALVTPWLLLTPVLGLHLRRGCSLGGDLTQRATEAIEELVDVREDGIEHPRLALGVVVRRRAMHRHTATLPTAAIALRHASHTRHMNRYGAISSITPSSHAAARVSSRVSSTSIGS